LTSNKKIKIIAAVFAALFIIYFAANAILSSVLHNQISKINIDGSKISAENIKIQPFKFGISIKTLSLENRMSAQNIFVRLNILKFFTKPKTPLEYIQEIKVSDIEISFDPNSSVEKLLKNILEEVFLENALNIYAENISFKDIPFLSLSNSELSLAPQKAAFSSNIKLYSRIFNASYQLEPAGGNLLKSQLLLSSNEDLKAYISLSGRINKKTLSFSKAIRIESLVYNDFQILKTSGNISSGGGDLLLNLTGDFLNLTAASKDFKEFYLNGSLKGSKINENLNSDIKFAGSYKNETWHFNAKTDSFSLYGAEFGKLDFDIFKDAEENKKIVVKNGKSSEIRLNLLGENADIFDLKLYIRGKPSGYFYLNKKEKIMRADISNAKISDLPVNPFYRDNAGGTLSIFGTIKDNAGNIVWHIENFKTSKIQKMNIEGSLSPLEEKVFLFNFYDNLNYFSINASIKLYQLISADFKFSNIDISHLARILKYGKNSFSGISEGQISYRRGESLDFNIKAENGIFYYENAFKEFSSAGSLNSEKIEIKSLSIIDKKGAKTADISAFLHWADKNQKSSFSFILNDFKIKGVKMSALVNFSGKLESGGAVSGGIKNALIKINNVSFPSLAADLKISNKSFEMEDIESSNGLDGYFKYILSSGDLDGGIQLKNTNIAGIYPELSAGALNAEIDIKGRAANPSFRTSFSLKKAGFRQIPFTADGSFLYSDGELSLNKFSMSASGAKIAAKGKYSRNNFIEFSFENAGIGLVEKLFKTVMPFQNAVFAGNGIILSGDAGIRVELLLSGSNFEIKNFRADKMSSNIKISNNMVSIDDSSIKSADSELKIQNAWIDLKKGTFSAELSLINAVLGPANLFGTISLSGRASKSKTATAYSGDFVLSDFWINKGKINKLSGSYSFENGDFIIKTANPRNLGNAPSAISAVLRFGDTVDIKSFTFASGASYLSGSGYFGKNDFSLNLDSSNLDLEVAGNFADLPIGIAGSANLHFNGGGAFKNPSISASLTAINGSVMDIPFDSANIRLAVENNEAKIIEGKLSKKGEIDLSIVGEFPLWLDNSLRSEMENRNINIRYDFANSKLSVFKYLTDSFIRPSAGQMSFSGNINGTLKNLKNNGNLIISDGTLDFKSYLGRMKNIDIEIAVEDSAVKIKKWTATAKNGSFFLAEGGLKMNFFDIEEMDIRLFTQSKGAGIPLEIPDLPIPNNILSDIIWKDISKGEPSFDIYIKGSASAPKISGQIILENARFNFPPPEGSGNISFIPQGTEFNIDFLSSKSTVYENASLTVLANGKVNISGVYPELKAQGIVNTQKGEIRFLGKVFDILNGQIEILEDNIYVQCEAETAVYSADTNNSDLVKLIVSRSPIDNLNFAFSSRENPSMNSESVIAKVLGLDFEGKTDPKTEEQDNTNKEKGVLLTDFEVRQQAIRLINSNLVVPIARTFLRRTGIADNLKVSYSALAKIDANSANSASPDGSGESVAPSDPVNAAGSGEQNSLVNFLYGTKYSIEKNITNQLVMGYSLFFDQLNNQLALKHGFEMTYRLTNNLSIMGSYELEPDDPSQQADRKIMIQNTIRFGGAPADRQNKSGDGGN
jgi:hypothetical protein